MKKISTGAFVGAMVLLACVYFHGGAGATDITNKLGNDDGAVFKVTDNSGNPILTIEADATSPNIIAGYSGNSVTSGKYGAVIAGGGSGSGDPPGDFNMVTENYGTVSGGSNNTADANHATVGGGHDNTASGFISTVAGGRIGVASANYATVGGGYGNTAGAQYSTVAGGYGNTAALLDNSTVAGGTKIKHWGRIPL